MAATTTHPRRQLGPRAPGRRGWRYKTPVPAEPDPVVLLAHVARARLVLGRLTPWDARLESSLSATLGYLWRRGRGERWAGRGGSGQYACSIAQLVAGLAPVMGWQGSTEQLVTRHRSTVQRWLDWLGLAGLVEHHPARDGQGFWWRTVVTLKPAVQLPDGELERAARRHGSWERLEHRRNRRGRRRNLTSILARARLTAEQRRERAILRHRTLKAHAERARVRLLIQTAIGLKAHLRHPLGASTTSQGLTQRKQNSDTPLRRLTRVPLGVNHSGHQLPTPGHSFQQENSGDRDDQRWAIYNQVLAERYGRADSEWQPYARSLAQNVAQLGAWPEGKRCPSSLIIDAWTLVSHGPTMAAAAGGRLAMWLESRHRPILDRALARYQRHSGARPPGFPKQPVQALAHWLAHHATAQQTVLHGLAYDIHAFDKLTKQMSAYKHAIEQRYLERADGRAKRRAAIKQLAEKLSLKLSYRLGGESRAIITARELLERSSDPAKHREARKLLSVEQRAKRLEQRDWQLLAGRLPVLDDHRYRAAVAYAERWGMPIPTPEQGFGAAGELEAGALA